MQIAIMQPYFLPYIGYYQLIGAVDQFVIYDAIQYTKKGWINRNRMLRNGAPVTFSIPLEKASDYLDIKDRRLSDAFDRRKLLNQISGAYRRAPQFEATMAVLTEILEHDDDNLFGFLRHGLEVSCRHLGLDTPIVTSSDIEPETGLRNQDRVLDICARLKADRYVNPIGGVDLYAKGAFAAQGVELRFLKTRDLTYDQGGSEFHPHLSILDVMMFNTPEQITHCLTQGFDLLDPEHV